MTRRKHVVLISVSLLMTPGYRRRSARVLSVIEAWSERCYVKMNEDKAQAIYFSHRLRPSEPRPTPNGRNIPFVNHVKYLGLIFGKRITWRLHLETIEAKAFRRFVIIYSLFKSERLSANIKLTLHKALIRSVMAYACPA
jgi:hypothetical protein